MTLEGCVVKFADTIAYIGRDLQDAQEVGLIKDMNDVPAECKEILGTDNRAIIDTLIHDLLDRGDADREGFITSSPGCEHALVTLRAFSRKRISNNPNLTTEREKIRTMYRILFLKYLGDAEADAVIQKFFGISRFAIGRRDYLRSTSPPGSSVILSQA